MGSKLGSKSQPKRLRKPCRKRGPQKHPTGPEKWANIGPTWPPKGHQIRPKIGQTACRSLTGTPSCWKHAILAPPGPLQDPLGGSEGPIWEPLGAYFGVPSGLIWGPFGGSRGSVLLPFFKACVRPRKGQFCGLRELISVPVRDIWGLRSWPLRQKEETETDPKIQHVSPIITGTARRNARSD